MCGRYSLTTPVEALWELFRFPEQPNVAPRYNIAPTQNVATVRLGEDGARHLHMLRLGLIPTWAKDAAIGNRMIRASNRIVRRLATREHGGLNLDPNWPSCEMLRLM